MALELMLDTRSDLGEGPAWDADLRRLSWVDITAGEILISDLESVTSVISIGEHVGAALPSCDGGFLAVRRDGFVRVDPAGAQVELTLPLRSAPTHRFNDAKADPAGRAWAGTMAYDIGSGGGVLYRLDPGPRASPIIGDVGLSNGLGWDPDASTMFHVDSLAKRVDAYPYDLSTGELGDRRTFCDVGSDTAMPDGLCVDDDGCVWIAMWGGSRIDRYSTDGVLIDSVPLPVSQPTSCCFVDTTLVITTARYGLTADQLNSEPHAGGVFAFDAGVGGPPATPFKDVDSDARS